MAGIKFGAVRLKNIKLGTTQVRKVKIDGVQVWSAGIFSAAIVDYNGSGPFGLSDGNYTFDVIGSSGTGTGGQIIGSVGNAGKLLSVVSVTDGGEGHEIGDILELEQTGGATWFQNPKIEVTAL